MRTLHEPVPSSIETEWPGHPYSFPAPLYESACSSALVRNSFISLGRTQAWDIFIQFYNQPSLHKIYIEEKLGIDELLSDLRAQRGLVGSASACSKAGPSSILGSAPHGGSS